MSRTASSCGLVLNFSPIQFDDREITVGRLPYGNGGEQALQQLRDEHCATHIFRREWPDSIFAVPVVAGTTFIGEPETILLKENLGLVAALIRNALLNDVAALGRTSLAYEPMKVISRRDLLRISCPPGITPPDWLSVRLLYEMAIRPMYFSGRDPFIAALLDVRTTRLIERSAAELIGDGMCHLVAQFEQARAQGEVAFRQSELKGRWGEWSGVFPWEGERDPDTTDCPWWVAGAEYVFHLTAAWRKYSPGEPEKIEALLPKQIEMSAEWVYQSKVRLYDIMRGKSSNAEHILIGHSKRFFNVAFLYSMQKFAEIDLDEWRDQATRLAGAITDLKSESANQSVPRSAPAGKVAGTSADQAHAPNEGRGTKKPVRSNQKYKVIDAALEQVADGRPSTQEEVFQSLDARHVVIPPAEPFVAARGWIAGFRRDPPAARAWLSKRWTELSLSPLPRGPKKSQK